MLVEGARVALGLLAGVGMVALAVAVLAIDARRPLHRAFAVWLVLRGVWNAVSALVAWTAADPPTAAYFARVEPYFGIAMPFATTAFLLVHLRRGGASAIAALAAAAVLLDVLYARDLATYYASGDPLSTRYGPLALFSSALLHLVYAVGSLVFAREFAREGGRASSWILAFAFALLPAFGGTIAVASLVATASGSRPALFEVTWPWVAEAVWCVALGVLVAAFRRLSAADASAARRYVVGLAVPGLAGVAAGAYLASGGPVVGLLLADAFFTLAFPSLVAYALLRHRLFDLDVKVRWTISRGTVAAAFVLAFFVATQIAQEYLSDELGVLLGGATAGALLFALAPLQRLADRVASTVVPAAKPVAQMDADERAAFYREAVRVAWADGALSLDERRMLEHARERLGLSREEAGRLEQDVVGA